MSSVQSTADAPAKESSSLRLWIEFATSSVAWLSLNCLNSVIAWRACVHQEPLGGPNPNPVARIFFFAAWIVIAGAAVTSGVLAYRTWRKLSGATDLLAAEGRDRKEYMALCGLFMTITLGMGFFWLVLPLFILQMCLRIR